MIAPQTLAEALDNSEFTIHRWIREGKIKAVKLSSRCTRIDGDSLAEFLSARIFHPGSKEAQPDQLKRKKNTAIELAGQG
jgi:predicted site-specific integrase-resolvase